MKSLIFYSNIPFTKSCLRLGILFICFSTLFMVGCKEDLIEPNSKLWEEFSVSLPQETTTLIRGIDGGDSLKAQINFPGQSGNQFDTSAYTYLWTSLINQDTLSDKHYLTYRDFDSQNDAMMSCLLAVKEKKTGITKYATSTIFVTTATREGWIILGEQSGKASLSMLTYTAQGYRKFVDLESTMGIKISFNGKPVSIDVLGTDIAFGGINQWLGVSTDQEIKVIKTMDFVEKANISAYLTNVLQPSAGHPVTFAVNGVNTFVASKDNNVYSFNTRRMVFNGRLERTQINTLTPGQLGAEVFKASPIHTFMDPLPMKDYSRLMYDEDRYQFVSARLSGNAEVNGVFPLLLPFSLQGFQQRAMSTRNDAGQGEVTSFLYNPTNNESYITQFLSNGILKSVKKIAAIDVNDIVQSKFIEIDYNTGCLIYTKGNEVKAYDYKIRKTISLLNLGNEEITLVKMTKHIPPHSWTSGREVLYKELLKRLIVCTYNASKPTDGGTFRLFQMRLGHQAPVKETEESGFPKIVDVAFSPIP